MQTAGLAIGRVWCWKTVLNLVLQLCGNYIARRRKFLAWFWMVSSRMKFDSDGAV